MNLGAPSESDIRESDPDDYGLRREWWESKRMWFADRGYVLNKIIYAESGTVWAEEPMSTSSREVRYPYSYVGGCKTCEPICTLPHTQCHPRIALAQDSESRHVVIKVLLSDSEEFKVLKFLQQEKDLQTQFHGVIPVLDMLPFGAFHFAVLPRWGVRPTCSWFETTEEVLHYIRCLLKGLTFLHNRRIFHRDVTDGNILANHFSCYEDCLPGTESDMRTELRKAGVLNYALNDFDWSMLLPPDVGIKSFHLPIAEIHAGVWEKPHEALRGEIDFNPFAYDVGCLGIHFAYTFQHLCLSIPLLAPLLDGMVTSHVGERFTAQEALTFLDEAQSEMTREQLDTYPSIRTQVISFDECDRWSDIPPSLIEKWGRYRERPPPYFAKHVIYPLCLRPWGVSLVYRIRVVFRWALFVCRLPLQMASHFLSL